MPELNGAGWRPNRPIARALHRLLHLFPPLARAIVAAIRSLVRDRRLSRGTILLLTRCLRFAVDRSGPVEVRTPGGFVFDVSDAEQDVNQAILLRGGDQDLSWEPATTALLLRLVRPEDCVVIGGANVGFDAVILGRSLQGPAGRCYAFEPVARNQATLSRNIVLNGLEGVVEGIRAALGRCDGEASISQGAANSSLVHDAPGLGRESVPLHRLDTLHAAGRIRSPSALLLDVEGSELDILLGAGALLELATLRFVVLEFNQHGEGRPRCAAILELLAARGFQVWAIDDDYHGLGPPASAPRRLVAMAGPDVPFVLPYRWFNVLALRPECRRELEGSWEFVDSPRSAQRKP